MPLARAREKSVLLVEVSSSHGYENANKTVSSYFNSQN